MSVLYLKIIFSKCKVMDPSLIDSSALSDIPSDITFKFTKGDGGEIAANKTILALVSKVFRNMFFVHNTKDKFATEMVLEDTTKPLFQIMLDAIHKVKPMRESLQDKSVDEMFAVLYLVNKYEIPKLLQTVKESFSSFHITEDNVLEVATDAMEYSTNFEEASQILLLACAKFLKPKVSDSESFIRFVAENGDHMATVQKLAVLMKDMPPPPSNSSWCDGCQRNLTDCLNGSSVTKDNVKVGVKVMEKYKMDGTNRIGVVVGKDESSDNCWFIRWENNKKTGKNCICKGISFQFKCR